MGMPGYLSHASNLAVAATLSASTEDAAYPLANLVDGLVGVPFRMTATSGWIELDFTTAMAPTAIVVGNHNLTSGTIDVTAGAAPAPVTAVVSIPFRQYDMAVIIPAESHRYWRLTFPTAPANISVGQLMVGLEVALPRRYAYQGHTKGRRRSIVTHESENGVVRSFLRYERRIFGYTWNMLTEAQVDADILAFDALLAGTLNPVAWWPDLDSDEEAYIVRLSDEGIQADSDDQGYWGYSINLNEESRGADIT